MEAYFKEAIESKRNHFKKQEIIHQLQKDIQDISKLPEKEKLYSENQDQLNSMVKLINSPSEFLEEQFHSKFKDENSTELEKF